MAATASVTKTTRETRRILLSWRDFTLSAGDRDHELRGRPGIDFHNLTHFPAAKLDDDLMIADRDVADGRPRTDRTCRVRSDR